MSPITRKGSVIVFDPVTQTMSTEKLKHLGLFQFHFFILRLKDSSQVNRLLSNPLRSGKAMCVYTRTPAAPSLNPRDASSLPSISINSDGPRMLSGCLVDAVRYTSWSFHSRAKAQYRSRRIERVYDIAYIREFFYV